MTQSFPLLAFTPLVRSLSGLWGRHFSALEKQNWSIGGTRPNPDICDATHTTNMLDRLITTLRNRSLRRRWRLELRALDDQQLSDIGVSRVEIERTVDRLRFWI